MGHERLQIVNAGLVGNPGPTWHVKGTGDFFGDGHTDLVMQNADGSVVLWDMSGSHIINAGVVGNPGASWNVLDDNMRFIYGTSANETLAATPAAPDEFVLTSLTTGSDTISGFNPAQDMIEFSKAQFASFTDVQAATSAVSGGAMINLANGSSLLLPGVDAGIAARQQLRAGVTNTISPVQPELIVVADQAACMARYCRSEGLVQA